MPTVDDRAPLLSYLRVQQQMDVEISTILHRASEDAEKALLALQGNRVGDTIRAAQIRQAQAAINRAMAVAFQQTGDVVRARRADAAAAAVKSNMDPFVDLFSTAGMDAQRIEAMLRSQTATAVRGVTNAVSRVTLTSIPLSERVYKTKAMSSGQLDRIITSGIARGVSHQELANAVKGFIRPDVPGGVPYAANRLARTELNNAFHGTQLLEAQKSPFITAMRWHLSGSHPRPDECNDYESGGDLADGLWSPGRVPGKPHPNCLCWMTAETPSREDFLKNYQTGQYNDFLEANGSPTPPALRVIESPKVPAVAPGVPKAAPAGKFTGNLNTTDAVSKYATGVNSADGNFIFSHLNDGLRTGKVLTPEVEQLRRGLDAAFDAAKPLTSSKKVYRQLDDASIRQTLIDSSKSGKVWEEKGFASTTTDLDIIGDFDQFGEGIRMNITIPKGAKALDVDDILKDDDFGMVQSEWLLPRGTKFDLSKPRQGPDGWEIDARVIVDNVVPAAQRSVADRIIALEKNIKSEQARMATGTPSRIRIAKANIEKSRKEIAELRKSASKKTADLSPAQKIKNAETMFGTGSPQHKAAIKKFSPKAPANKMPYQLNPARSLKEARERVDAYSNHPGTLRDIMADFRNGQAQAKKETPTKLKKVFLKHAPKVRERLLGEEARTAVWVPQSRLKALLDDGKFKNAHEVKSSIGADVETYLRTRKALEDVIMGVPVDAPAALRPIYGYRVDSLAEKASANATSIREFIDGSDGAINVIMKRDLDRRSSLNLGDSLNKAGAPIRQIDEIAKYTDEEMSGFVQESRQFAAYDAQQIKYGDGLSDNYQEVQIHGGVTLDDIEKLVVDYRPYTRSAEYFKPGHFDGLISELDDLVALAKKKGLTVDVRR